MKALSKALVVLGVCLGALGASGFHVPLAEDFELETTATREDLALPLFLLGIVTLGVGGYLTRAVRRSGLRAARTAGGGLDSYRAEIECVRDIVADLYRRNAELTDDALRERLDKLLREELFDLTSKSDDLILLVGFNDYARVWDGIATAERLLARAWSLITDGHPAEGRVELGLAKNSLEAAVRIAGEL